MEISTICVLFLQLTSFGAPATQYVLPFFYISPFSTIVASVPSQFSTSQLSYMIVLATRIIYGDPTVNAQKSGQGELARP